jgi:hypothetical protein
LYSAATAAQRQGKFSPTSKERGIRLWPKILAPSPKTETPAATRAGKTDLDENRDALASYDAAVTSK